MVAFHVFLKADLVIEVLLTDKTLESLWSIVVGTHVNFESDTLKKVLPTDVTMMRFFPCVYLKVTSKDISCFEALITVRTHIVFNFFVYLHVRLKVEFSCKLLSTYLTLELEYLFVHCFVMGDEFGFLHAMHSTEGTLVSTPLALDHVT